MGDLIILFYSNRSQKSDLKIQKSTQISVRGAVMEPRSQKDNAPICGPEVRSWSIQIFFETESSSFNLEIPYHK